MSEGDPVPLKKRRWLRRLLVILGIAGVAVYFIFRDEELKPVDDLMPQHPAIAWDDNNGWKRLDDFWPRLPVVDSDEHHQMHSLRYRKDYEPNPAGAKKFAFTESQIAELESMAAAPQFQGVSVEDHVHSPGGGFHILQGRLSFTIVSATEENRVSLVLRILKLSATLQRRMTAGATSLYDYSMGTAWINDALVARCLVRLDWSEPELKELAAILSGDPVIHEEAREAICQDFRSLYNFLINSPGAPPVDGIDVPRFLYQKHRTANQLAEQTRVMRDSILVSSWQELRRKQDAITNASPFWLDQNLYGRRFLQGPGRVYSGSLKDINARRRSMQVIIALHRFQKAHGSPPASLNSLVPEFLPSVPEDPFNFAPLHWDSTHRAVQNTGGERTIPPVNPKQTQLISDDERTFLFRTKAEEDARRASLPPPAPAKLSKSKTPAKPPVPAPKAVPNNHSSPAPR